MNADPRFWIIAGGAAWLAVAIAIFGRIVARPEPRLLSRAAGARCLLGALLGVGTLALVIWSTSDLPVIPRTVVSLLAHAGFATFLIGFAAHVEPGREILGLNSGAPHRDVLRGVAIYVAFVPVVIAAHVLTTYFVGDDVETVQKNVHDFLAQEGPGRLALIANLVLAVPLFEELLFRGMLQQGIKAQFAFVALPRQASALSVLLASIAFTLLHEPPTYIPVFVLSLILGASFDRSGRILVPVALHAMHNLAVVLFQTVPRPWGGGP